MEEERTDQAQETTDSKEKSLDSNSLYAVLSYIWILVLIPILMKKDNEFVMFHARQGLILFIVEIGVGIFSIVPVFGPVIYTIGMLACAVVALVAIVQVLMGNKWEIPLIGEWARKLRI